MGMFDRISFNCPRCGLHIEEQSKAGECLLVDFTSDEVPATIAADIVGHYLYCSVCDKGWTIVQHPPVPAAVKMGLA